MPTFEFTSPDGKTYEVDAPDGATHAQAFSVLQGQFAAAPPASKLGAVGGGLSAIGSLGIAKGAVNTPTLPGLQATGAQIEASAADLGGTLARFAPAMPLLSTVDILNPGMRQTLNQVADDSHNWATQRRGEADALAAQSSVPFAKEISSGIGTLSTQVPLAMTTGGLGNVAYAASNRYSQGVAEGHAKGLSETETQRYAARAGAIEGVTTAVFNKLGQYIPGLGGTEAMFTKKAVVEGAKRTARQKFGEILGTVGGELGEETAIAYADALNQRMSGVNPNAKTDFWGVAKQVAVTMGLAHGVRAYMERGVVNKEGVAAYAERNPEQAAKLAETETASRKAFEDNGLGGESTAKERAEFHKTLREVQAAKDEPGLPTADVVNDADPIIHELAAPPVAGEAIPPQRPTGGVAQNAAQQSPNTENTGATPPLSVAQHDAPEGATSIKNAVVEQERAKRGLPPADEVGHRSFGTVWDEAKAKIADDPTLPEKLQGQLMANPRAVTDAEDAILLYRQVTLQSEHSQAMNDLAAAKDADNADAVADAEARVGRASNQLLELYNVNKSVGTETGRGLAARKMLAMEDFTLANMEVQRRAANGGAQLTPQQASEVKGLHDRINRMQKAYDDYVATAEERLRTTQADLAVAKMAREKNAAKKVETPKGPKGYGSRNKLVTTDAYEKALADLRDPSIMRAGIPLDKFLIISAYHVEAGARTFADFSAKMIRDLGEQIRPRLEELYQKSVAHLGTQDRETIKTKIKEKIDEKGDAADLSTLIQKLARQFVSEGVTERRALVDAVHNEIKDIAPDMTPRDTMDAISGYGQFSQLSKDEVSAKLRDLKGQMQQVGKIQDMQWGEAPKKTGVERRTPSDEERRLIKKVNELKKKGDYVVTDPETQLRTALNAVKSRLKNQIADLTEAIASRTPVGPKEKSTLAYDADAESLRKNRDALKSEYDSIFGTPGMSDAQRLKNAESAATRALERLEKQAGNARNFQFLTPKPERPATPKSAKLDAIRAQQAELRAEIEELRAIAHPGLTPEERALKAYKTRTAREITKLTEKVANGDFSTRKPVEYTLDDHAKNLRFGLDKAKRQWNEALFNDSLARESVGQKAYRRTQEAMNTGRAIKTSFDLSAPFRQGGFVLFAHPIRGLRAIPGMFRALKSEKAQYDAEQEIQSRKNYPLYRRSGLHLSEIGSDLSKMEEAYMSRWAEKIPGVAASQRAFSTFLNRLRADSFDAMVHSVTGGLRNATANEAKIIANAVNVFTGRGSLGIKNENVLAGLNTALFAPRFVASRFQTLLGQPIYHGVFSGKADFKNSAKVRSVVAAEYGRYLAGIGVIFGLAAMAGHPPEEDPNSSDFGKIKVNNTRIDLLSGLSQAWVLISRMWSGKRKDKFGDVEDVNRATVAGRFLRTKLSPAVGSTWNLMDGKDLRGKEVSFGSEAVGSVLPLSVADAELDEGGGISVSFGDVQRAIEDNGVPKGTAIALLMMFGASIQTYDAETPEDRTKRIGSIVNALTDPVPKRKDYTSTEKHLKAKTKHAAAVEKAQAKAARLNMNLDELKSILRETTKARGDNP